MAEVFLRRLTRWQAETQRESVADLHAAAHHGRPAADGVPDRAEFLRRFAGYDIQRPGFDMVIGSDPALVGCCYGYAADREGDWLRACSAGLPDELPDEVCQAAAAGRLFLLAGLMVLPAHRRTGVATRLAQTLLIRSNAALALAPVAADNAPARAAFRSWGWRPPAGAGARLEPWTRPLP
ncbi:GNAT family N-acetyltransferase [Streptomyces chattanoogensis]|uniref:GNAT family N-acetyltransferase n=1 Tax=Streptomyces chattanoogensis TaxID=66876 RepID=UPI0006B67FA2|nr:GNAT family N-acetyltransferase [Streptomyces chattanoogensis]